MALKIRLFTIPVDGTQRLEMAQGESCRFRMTFIESTASPTAGLPLHLGGASHLAMNIKWAGGTYLRATGVAFSSPASGIAEFLVSIPTAIPEQLAHAGIEMRDASGYKQALMRVSPFVVTRGAG